MIYSGKVIWTLELDKLEVLKDYQLRMGNGLIIVMWNLACNNSMISNSELIDRVVINNPRPP